MKLRDTVDIMLADNYIDNFKAEYFQLENRLNSLCEMIEMIMTEGYSEFVPLTMLLDQKKIMQEYKQLLGSRAIIEGIEL